MIKTKREYDVYQTQHRLELPKYIAQKQAEGFELLGPVQFVLYGDHKAGNPATYYLATFYRDTEYNPDEYHDGL